MRIAPVVQAFVDTLATADDVERIDDDRLRVTVDDGPDSDHGRYELFIESVEDESCYPILDQGDIDALWPGARIRSRQRPTSSSFIWRRRATAPRDAEVVA